MTKLFKNSKNALAFVLAFAVIVVSLFTGVAINANAETSTAKKTLYWNERITTEPKTTDDDGNILITSAAELAWLVANPDTDKSYKVKDDISTIVLQPENAVEISKLISYTNYSDVKTYFEKNYTSTGYTDDTAHLFKWTALDNQEKAFKGTFDGNGVTIYGMYSVGGETGLFAWLAAGATIKNVAIKNSYSKATDGAGAVFARLSNHVATGLVNIENCEVSGCYCESSATDPIRVGVLFGFNSYDNRGVAMNKILVHGNYAVNANEDKCGLYGGVASGYNGENTDNPNVNLFDSIILDCTPHSVKQNNQATRVTYYRNVYANEYDAETGIPSAWFNGASYKDKIFEIEVTTLSDVTAEMTTGLDYTNSWIMTVNGPQLRALHGEFKATSNGTDGHTLACEDCGLKTSTISEPHTYDKTKKDGKCTACGYECKHSNKEHANKHPADCEHAATYDEVCKDCGKTLETNVDGDPATGHDTEKVSVKAATCTEDGVKTSYYVCKNCHKWFKQKNATTEITKTQKSDYIITAGHNIVSVTEVPATCEGTGTSAHYKCDRDGCGKLFTDANGTTETALKDLTIPAKGHTAKKDNDDKIIYKQVDGKHYKICSVCSTDENEKLFDEEVCTCDEFTADNNGTHSGACKVCGLQVAVNCDLEKVEKVDATTEKAGVKEHYKCSVCEALYEDAEGKTPTTLEKLATVNGDKNNESPKTGDSVATVSVAILAIIAAGYVLVRKFVKA